MCDEYFHKYCEKVEFMPYNYFNKYFKSVSKNDEGKTNLSI